MKLLTIALISFTANFAQAADCFSGTKLVFQEAFDLSAPYIESDSRGGFLGFRHVASGHYTDASVISYDHSGNGHDPVRWSQFCILSYERKSAERKSAVVPKGTEIKIARTEVDDVQGVHSVILGPNAYGVERIACMGSVGYVRRNTRYVTRTNVVPTQENVLAVLPNAVHGHRDVLNIKGSSCKGSFSYDAPPPRAKCAKTGPFDCKDNPWEALVK